MTLRMLDAIFASRLTAGADAYAGYTDGSWADYPAIASRFPGAHLLSIAVFERDDADALDIENGDATPEQAPGWTQRQLGRKVWRPCLYASVDSMQAVIDALTAAGIGRTEVRLWSAHYGQGKHICGPDTCKLISVPVDGTQWTDATPGDGGPVDESELNDDFFAAAPVDTVPAWEADMMKALPLLRQGDHGDSVRTVQGLCGARGHAVTIDGIFGPSTDAAVKACQAAGHVTDDGVVGPATWPVLVGV